MIKESFSLYNRHLIKILFMNVMLVIPLTLFCYLATYYLFQQLNENQYPNLYALFFIVINFTLVIPIFMKIAITDLEDEEAPSLMELGYDFIRHFGLILFITIPFYIIGILGSGLLFIPTLICFTIILLFPFFVDRGKVSDVFRKVGNVLRDENIFLLLDLLVVASTQLIVSGLMMISFANFENNIYVFGLAKALVNALIFPLLIFYLTFRYRRLENTF